MSHVLCSLCQTDRVLVDYGPVCDACRKAADPTTLDGALLHVFVDASRSDDCTGWATSLDEMLRPLVLPQATWEPFEPPLLPPSSVRRATYERTAHAGYACWVLEYDKPRPLVSPRYEWMIGRPVTDQPSLVHSGNAPTREVARACALWAAQARRIIDACLRGEVPLQGRSKPAAEGAQ